MVLAGPLETVSPIAPKPSPATMKPLILTVVLYPCLVWILNAVLLDPSKLMALQWRKKCVLLRIGQVAHRPCQEFPTLLVLAMITAESLKELQKDKTLAVSLR